jgi:hypothetical protein
MVPKLRSQAMTKLHAAMCLTAHAPLLLLLSSSVLISQTLPARVEIRFGLLDTTSYPSPSHPTEWKQELIADLYDSAGHVLPPSQSYMYSWGVDFCKGFGMGFGWAAGYGLSSISPDGNKIKTEAGCCTQCPFQTYLVGVRVTIGEDLVRSKVILIPNIAVPSAAGVSLNYPNPFSARTYIRFQLNEYSRVHLRVFDILGQSMGELLNQYLAPGYHTVTWQPANVPGGIYFYRLTIDPNTGPSLTRIEKMILLK